jgi:hypothetical protein
MDKDTFIMLEKKGLESIIVQDSETKEVKILSKFGKYDNLEIIMNSKNNKIEYFSGLIPLKSNISDRQYEFYYHLIIINDRFAFHAMHSLNLPGAREVFKSLQLQDTITFDLAAIKNEGFIIKTEYFISQEFEFKLNKNLLNRIDSDNCFLVSGSEINNILYIACSLKTKDLFKLIKNI